VLRWRIQERALDSSSTVAPLALSGIVVPVKPILVMASAMLKESARCWLGRSVLAGECWVAARPTRGSTRGVVTAAGGIAGSDPFATTSHFFFASCGKSIVNGWRPVAGLVEDPPSEAVHASSCIRVRAPQRVTKAFDQSTDNVSGAVRIGGVGSPSGNCGSKGGLGEHRELDRLG
jgi:hypothetical protein